MVAICLRSFYKRFWNISVSRVAEILVKLGHGSEVIWWVSVTDPTKKFAWNARRFGENEEISKMCARQVRDVKFFGGPPGYWCNHSGSLLTVFMDRLLLAATRGGFNALDAAIPLQESYL